MSEQFDWASAHAVIEALSIPAATLAGLRDGSLVAAPREPTLHMTSAAIKACPFVDGWNAGAIYTAMLAASEAPGHE